MEKQQIEVNGKKYTLQHPGNREWIRIKTSFVKIQDTGSAVIDMEPLLDYSFEHVVFPEEGKQLSLDTVDLKELQEVWGVILPRFLGGNLETGYIYPSKKRR